MNCYGGKTLTNFIICCVIYDIAFMYIVTRWIVVKIRANKKCNKYMLDQYEG